MFTRSWLQRVIVQTIEIKIKIRSKEKTLYVRKN
jgi:hypothetical protein